MLHCPNSRRFLLGREVIELCLCCDLRIDEGRILVCFDCLWFGVGVVAGVRWLFVDGGSIGGGWG